MCLCVCVFLLTQPYLYSTQPYLYSVPIHDTTTVSDDDWLDALCRPVIEWNVSVTAKASTNASRKGASCSVIV